MKAGRRWVVKGAVVFATMGVQTSLFAIDQALIDAAKKEGEVNWYSSLVVNQAARPIVTAFGVSSFSVQ